MYASKREYPLALVSNRMNTTVIIIIVTVFSILAVLSIDAMKNVSRQKINIFKRRKRYDKKDRDENEEIRIRIAGRRKKRKEIADWVYQNKPLSLTKK